MSGLVEKLTPENARVDLLTSQPEVVREALSWPSMQQDLEPWFNVAYWHADIPSHILAAWRRPDGAEHNAASPMPCPQPSFQFFFQHLALKQPPPPMRPV